MIYSQLGNLLLQSAIATFPLLQKVSMSPYKASEDAASASAGAEAAPCRRSRLSHRSASGCLQDACGQQREIQLDPRALQKSEFVHRETA